jgi:hypothetical protein
MRAVVLAAVLVCGLSAPAVAWGPEGHSVVGEIAQRRLSAPAAKMVEHLLGKGHALAATASWADNMRVLRPATANWHFVDIPIAAATYDAARDCAASSKGDCAVAELDRLRDELRCAPSEKDMIEALKFAVHFVGDIHQPLHTVGDAAGGNGIKVDVFMRGQKNCGGPCELDHMTSNFHKAWDGDLINKMVWDWGAYVDRLEDGWLKSDEAKTEAADKSPINHDSFVKWAEDTHKSAVSVWNLRPADNVLDDNYLNTVAPVLDRQLGLGGLRLARFLNQAYGSKSCPVR